MCRSHARASVCSAASAFTHCSPSGDLTSHFPNRIHVAKSVVRRCRHNSTLLPGTKAAINSHSCRARRKHHRLPSRLLIENASARRARLRLNLVRRGISDQG